MFVRSFVLWLAAAVFAGGIPLLAGDPVLHGALGLLAALAVVAALLA